MTGHASPASGQAGLLDAARGLLPTAAGALAVASLACLGYAWTRRTPDQPLVANRDEILPMLQATTIVAAVMVVVLIGYGLTARSGAGRSSVRRRRLELLRYLAPTLLVLAVIAIIVRRGGGVADSFQRSEWQQAALSGGVRLTSLTSIAWWCACLAVALVALRAMPAGHGTPRRGDGPRRALIACFAALAVGALVTLQMHQSFVVSAVAADAQPPAPLSGVTGEVAYEFAFVGRPDANVVLPGGPGFLRMTDDDVVAGVDGATGQTRWSFSAPDLSVYAVTVTSRGADGVAVLQAGYHGSSSLIGLDAVTGAPLWTRTGNFVLANRSSAAQSSADVVLAMEQTSEAGKGSNVDWVALSPREGSSMWTTTVPSECDTGLRLTRQRVIKPRCDGNVFADVLDARTGTTTTRLTYEALDLEPADFEGPPWVNTNPGSDLAVVSLQPSRAPFADADRIIDVLSGRVAEVLPEDVSAYFLDGSSLVVTRSFDGNASAVNSVREVDTGATVTGTVTSKGARLNEGPGMPWARVGDEWVTFQPRPGQLDGQPLNVFGRNGVASTLPSPCTHSAATPTVESVSAALLVNCGDRIVALR